MIDEYLNDERTSILLTVIQTGQRSTAVSVAGIHSFLQMSGTKHSLHQVPAVDVRHLTHFVRLNGNPTGP